MSDFFQTNKETYSQYSEEEKQFFWVTTIRTMMRMQSSVGDEYGIFCKGTFEEWKQLEPSLLTHLEFSAQTLGLDFPKMLSLFKLSQGDIQRKEILED